MARLTRTSLDGAPFAFDGRGRHELKGLPVPIDLYVVRPTG